MEEHVVLVNENGMVTGLMEKLEAHEKGILHKAISIIIYNSKGEMLLQQRARTKYHWPLIWSNACCSHPRDGENSLDAARRRVVEELGIKVELTYKFTFQYKATDEQSGLIEHERDDVFIGLYDGNEIPFNTEEVSAIQWISPSELKIDISKNPDKYSIWFKIILKEMATRSLF